MGEFEEAYRGHQLKLYVLPPRSPKLNGAVREVTVPGVTSSIGFMIYLGKFRN